MSLLFGEINEPDTRAFWDDYEDFEIREDSNRRSILNWTNSKNNNILEKIKSFIVFEGINIKDFINQVLIKNKIPVCEVNDANVKIYNFEDDNLVVCVSDERDLNKFGEVTELLLPWIEKATNCIGISIQSAALYKGNNDKEECFFRGIKSELKTISKLCEPNFVTGIVAGMFSRRLSLNLSASAYIGYTKSPFYDSLTVRPILNVMKRLNIPTDENYVEKVTNNSDLYM